MLEPNQTDPGHRIKVDGQEFNTVDTLSGVSGNRYAILQDDDGTLSFRSASQVQEEAEYVSTLAEYRQSQADRRAASDADQAAQDEADRQRGAQERASADPAGPTDPTAPNTPDATPDAPNQAPSDAPTP